MLSSVVVSAPRLKKKIDFIRQCIDKGWVEDVVGVGEEVRDYLRMNTPRSEGAGSQGGEHIADGWELHQIGGNPSSARGILLVIYNRFVTTAAGKILNRARLRVQKEIQDYTLMHILEYGSRPHPIPRDKDMHKGIVLRFFDSAGKIVFTRQVHHPGTQPVGMIRAARAFGSEWYARFQEKWAEILSRR